jgi:hypothetical protein
MGPSEGYITTDDGIRLFFQKLGSGQKTVIMPNAVFLFVLSVGIRVALGRTNCFSTRGPTRRTA